MGLTRQQLASIAEWIFITFGIFLLTNGLAHLLEAGTNLQGDSNPRQLLVVTAVYGVATILLLRRPGAPLLVLVRRPELLLIMLLPVVSALWSPEHAVVFRRGMAQALTVLFCIYLAERLTAHDFAERLLLTLFIGGVASLLVIVLLPSFGVTPDGPNAGSWRGIYGHKAYLGRIAVVAICAALIVSPRTRRGRWMSLATMAIFAVLCIGSQSRSAWLQAIGGGAVFGVLLVLANRSVSPGLKMTGGAVLAGVAAVTGLAAFPQLLAMFGRTETFSGRANLWNGAIEVAANNHPWLGAGYRGFWLGETADQVRTFVISFQRLPDHGHNGYLDTWLELGWVGVAVLALFLLLTGVRLLRRLLREPGSRDWMFFLMQLSVFLAVNLSATIAFRHSDISWALVILASIYTLKAQPKVRLWLAQESVERRAPLQAAHASQ